MDPIHPIVPITDRIPSVTGPARVERLKREPGHDSERRQPRDQRRPPDADADDSDDSDDDAGDERRPRVDISA